MTAHITSKGHREEGPTSHYGEHNLKDGQVSFSVGCMIAWGLWTLSALTLTVAVAFRIHELAAVAIVASVAAGTATMRTYFVRHNRMVRTYAELLIAKDNLAASGIVKPFR